MTFSKEVHRRLLALIASFSIMPMLALAASDAGVITVGDLVGAPICWWGYVPGYGSYSPTGLTGGETVAFLADVSIGGLNTCTGPVAANFEVSGFSSDPGQSWLTSVTCNGVTKTGTTAAGYSYSTGIAHWTWGAGTAFGFRAKVGQQLSCTITHS